ncbi:MAG: LLM class flavin-dependent oxidoreductase [Actinobacteria bacterium]|nr:LLM class flavin-dependent oxidoreductase [Actinomycetota bacterium]
MTMELGLCIIPTSLEATVEVAELAERGGIGWLGICDSPYLYAEPHACMQAAARATSAIRIGTFVTNPVTRHWTVQAAGFRALEELAPGRGFLGIAAGDSAVHSVGLEPASPAALEEYVARVREHGPDGLEVMTAAGGPRSARRAATYADHLVLGQGASEGAISFLASLAAEARAEAAAAPPELALWAFMLLGLADGEAEVEATRGDIAAAVVAYSRQAFDFTFEGKAVPEDLQEPLRRLYEQYSFEEHSTPGESRNARLLRGEGGPDLGSFLFERFALVGEPEAVAERLRAVLDSTGLQRIFLSAISADPVTLTRLLVDRLVPRLDQRSNSVATTKGV